MPNHFFLIGLLTSCALNRKRVISRRLASTRFNRRPLSLSPILLPFALGLSMCAQDFVPEHVVFPITDFKPDMKYLAPSMKFGTGFCLDPDCRFVGTNYHVAKLMGKYVRIKGAFSVHRYLDSDQDDAGAQDVHLAGGSLKYNLAHDLAIYEMRHPLKQFHGSGFDADDLEKGSEADIYAYPFNWNPKRKLVHWHGKFIGKTQDGLLAFHYDEGRVRGGASGGVVTDSKTQKIVGILSAIGEGVDHIALAVPVKELADFVARAQPYLQASLFPKAVFVSPVMADLYPPYVWPHIEGLPERLVEPPEVIKLRLTAQHLADSMYNFAATETFAWGRDNHEPELADAYETLIVDGSQRWRHPGSTIFHATIPFAPSDDAIISGAEWSYLPQMIGTELDLKIHQAPDGVVGGQIIHVFQYAAKVEDKVCLFDSIGRYGLFQHTSSRFYDCHGEVWMDESGTILRISQALDLSGPWYHWWGVMTYNWLEKDGRRYLVPFTITVQAEHNHTYWCRGLFTDYQIFDVKSRLVATK